MIYEEIFRALNAKKVNYVVVGGVGLVLHGVVRLTADLDLIVRLETKNLTKFISVIKGLGYRPKAPVKAEEFIDNEKRERWRKEKGMQVFSFYHPKKPAALLAILVNEPIDYEALEEEKEVIQAGSIKIPVVSRRHLIELKKISGRPQDIADINALKEVMKIEKKERGKKH
jgi:hypothetical protein